MNSYLNVVRPAAAGLAVVLVLGACTVAEAAGRACQRCGAAGCVDCIPNVKAFGYYSPQWRRWPGQEVVRTSPGRGERVETIARPAMEGPSLTPEQVEMLPPPIVETPIESAAPSTAPMMPTILPPPVTPSTPSTTPDALPDLPIDIEKLFEDSPGVLDLPEMPLDDDSPMDESTGPQAQRKATRGALEALAEGMRVGGNQNAAAPREASRPGLPMILGPNSLRTGRVVTPPASESTSPRTLPQGKTGAAMTPPGEQLSLDHGGVQPVANWTTDEAPSRVERASLHTPNPLRGSGGPRLEAKADADISPPDAESSPKPSSTNPLRGR